MSDAPVFTEKLIGFRGWSAVYPPEGVDLDHPGSIRLAQERDAHKQRAEALTKRIEELKYEQRVLHDVIERLGSGASRYRPQGYSSHSGGSYYGGGYLGGGTGMMLQTPLPPIEHTKPPEPVEPGLWTQRNTYWRPGRAVRARCQAGTYGGGMSAKLAQAQLSILSSAVTGKPLPARQPPEPHDAPGPLCTCGLHAQYEATGRTSVGVYTEPQEGWVVGAVTAWGRVEAHSTVFRAEYMEPVLLGFDPCGPPDLERKTRALAALYGIEAVELQDLGEAALRFGTPIPKEYRGRPKPREKSGDELKIPLLDARAGIIY